MRPWGFPCTGERFGVPQAERLLWRAGFGPRRGQAEALAKRGLPRRRALAALPGPRALVGPKPHDSKGHPIAPYDAWGHDYCGGSTGWCDSRPLVERMTLIWHDWFATRNAVVGTRSG